MATRNINTQNLFCVKLLELRRHLGHCNKCRAARKGLSYDDFCEYTKKTLVEIATKVDTNIAGRLAARNGNHSYIFPCPEPNAHGPAYALTAEAVIVESIQDRLC